MPVGREALHPAEPLVGHLLHVARGHRVPEEAEAEVAHQRGAQIDADQHRPGRPDQLGLQRPGRGDVDQVLGRARGPGLEADRGQRGHDRASHHPAPPAPEAGDEAQHLGVAEHPLAAHLVVVVLIHRRGPHGGGRVVDGAGTQGCFVFVARQGHGDAFGSLRPKPRIAGRKMPAGAFGTRWMGDKGEVLRSGAGRRPGSDLLSQNRSAGRAAMAPGAGRNRGRAIRRTKRMSATLLPEFEL